VLETRDERTIQKTLVSANQQKTKKEEEEKGKEEGQDYDRSHRFPGGHRIKKKRPVTIFQKLTGRGLRGGRKGEATAALGCRSPGLKRVRRRVDLQKRSGPSGEERGGLGSEDRRNPYRYASPWR